MPIATGVGALATYLAFYAKSKPHIAVYYQLNERQQSMIDLVIENIGSGTAFDVKFSQPLPVNWFGIEKPHSLDLGGFVPKSGVPCLFPGQRLVFNGGQYAGLLAQIGDGFDLRIDYKFHPPLWCEATGVDMAKVGIKHFCSMVTVKSMEQAVVDAITGDNATTVRDIRNALASIDASLASMTDKKRRAQEQAIRFSEQVRPTRKKADPEYEDQP